MKLSVHEVKQFYRIWFPLLIYINQKLEIVPEFEDYFEANDIHPEDAVPIREALWENDALREAFIKENPAKLSEGDLAIVDSWQYRVADSFFVFRYLKKHTVFLNGESPPKAYGVLGLTSSFEEMLGPYVPHYIQAVLLPFGDKIIYDSLFAPYSISFGGGIKSSLKDSYRAVQEREGVITSLLPPTGGNEASKKDIMTKNKKLLKVFQKDLGKSGLSPQKMIEHHDNVMKFAQEYLALQNPPKLLLDIGQMDITAYIRSSPRKVNLVSIKRFLWFLRDTGRIYYGDAEDMLAFLKKQRKT